MKTCLFCGSVLQTEVLDLGFSPISNEMLTETSVGQPQLFYPLKTYFCDKCYLMQVGEIISPKKLFNDYTYFSSYSVSWLNHARAYTGKVIEKFNLTPKNFVVEIASNDGYLLRNFLEKNIRVLGIEPAANVAEIAQQKGINTIVDFFDSELAERLADEYGRADLIVANNVFAHVPGITDFVKGLKILLNENGVITIEFPHLLNLIRENQFDTIYHEHFSYFSLMTTDKIFSSVGLKIFDVEKLNTHGGSLRIYVCHENSSGHPVTHNVQNIIEEEKAFGLNKPEVFKKFGEEVRKIKRNLLDILIKIKNEGKTIVAYGAPAKGNVLLNYCGIGRDFIDYAVDRNPHKQNKFLPGTAIPVYSPGKIDETKPDFILILPWNLKEEIMNQLEYTSGWNAKFIVPIPEPVIVQSTVDII